MPWLKWGSLSICAGGLLFACTSFDTERTAPERGSLGQELYAVLCERLGASVLTEDIEGHSFRGMCHPDASGTYLDTVDTSALPVYSGLNKVWRDMSIAKMEALSRRRSDLIHALDATFPDAPVTHPLDAHLPEAERRSVGGHQALSEFLTAIAPLHDENPIVQGGEPLFPALTRATARLVAGFAGPDLENPLTAFIDEVRADSARTALASMAGRQGYRPMHAATGAIGPVLRYHGLRPLLQTLTPLVREGARLHAPLQNVLAMTAHELKTAEVSETPLSQYTVESQTHQPNRPRTKVEIGIAALLASHEAFVSFDAEPHLIVQRDARGLAIPHGNQPGIPGTVQSPFVDMSLDGFADVDPSGRFLESSNADARVAPPFKVNRSQGSRAFDTHGRALAPSGELLYEYVDTSRTLAAAMLRDMGPLLRSSTAPGAADLGDSLNDLLRGAHLLLGAPKAHVAPWGGTYEGYDTAESPLVDLIHAAGQLMGHPRSDTWLKMIEKLVVEEEQQLAALISGFAKMSGGDAAQPGAAPALSSPMLVNMLAQVAKSSDRFKDLARTLADPEARAKLGPLLAPLEKTGLLPTLGTLISTLDHMEIQDDRAPAGTDARGGLDILHEMLVAAVDRDYAKEAGTLDRHGHKTLALSTGAGSTTAAATPQQVTPFELLSNALEATQKALEESDRKDAFSRGATQLMGRLLTVEGEGEDAKFVSPEPSRAPAALPTALPIFIELLREQINANCPEREQGVACTWATQDLSRKAAEAIEAPTFGTLMTLVDRALGEPAVREQVSNFLHAVLIDSDGDVRHATLGAVADILQLIGDDTRLPTLYWAASQASLPGSDEHPGALSRLLSLADVLTDHAVVNDVVQENPYDPWGVLAHLLGNLVTPVDASDPESDAPLFVFMDVISEVNRYDASLPQDTPLDAADYGFVFSTVRDFLTSETRGLEQFYEIIHNGHGS